MGSVKEEDVKNLKENCGKPFGEIEAGEYVVDYGFDHVVGYFLMGFDIQEPEEVAFDFDSMFHGLDGAMLGYFLKMYQAPKDHVDKCFLDRDF